MHNRESDCWIMDPAVHPKEAEEDQFAEELFDEPPREDGEIPPVVVAAEEEEPFIGKHSAAATTKLPRWRQWVARNRCCKYPQWDAHSFVVQ